MLKKYLFCIIIAVIIEETNQNVSKLINSSSDFNKCESKAVTKSFFSIKIT